MTGEDKRVTLNLSADCSGSIKDLAEDIADFVTESKYKLTFLQSGRTFKLSDPISDITLG